MDPTLRHFRQFGRYNTLANQRLYDACARLTDDERRRDRRGFFRSIHGTLNHIMVGDRIWMARLEGGEAVSTNLDAILYDDFDALHEARAAEDVRIERFVAALHLDDLDVEIAYVNYAGTAYSDPVSLVLPHVFNHQTHHRGQVHDMLSQAGIDTPVLDMHRVLRPNPGQPVDMA